MNPRRSIPAVEKVLRDLGTVELPRATVWWPLTGLRQNGDGNNANHILSQIRSDLESLRRTCLQPVINGTGNLLHTNLRRAPLGSQLLQDLTDIGAGYNNNLEYALAACQRGGRTAYQERALALLGGAEAGMVVNNCAAAFVLILRHFTRKRPKVLILRGEMVQIGGGFCIPEILETSLRLVVPLLETLDREGVTRREWDKRCLKS